MLQFLKNSLHLAGVIRSNGTLAWPSIGTVATAVGAVSYPSLASSSSLLFFILWSCFDSWLESKREKEKSAEVGNLLSEVGALRKELSDLKLNVSSLSLKAAIKPVQRGF